MTAWSKIDLDFSKGHKIDSWVDLGNLNMVWRFYDILE